MVMPDKIDNRGAVGTYLSASLIVFDHAFIFPGHHISPERYFGHVIEAQLSDHSNQKAEVGDLTELGRETGGDTCCNLLL